MSHQPVHQISDIPPISNDPPIITIDLITFTSDGTHHFPTTSCLLPDAQYLPVLSDVFNMHGYGALTHNGSVNFVNNLPLGYTASHSINGTGHWCMGVWGHPCGGMFSSMCAFCPHVVSIITNSLGECGCELCVIVTSGAEVSEDEGGRW